MPSFFFFYLSTSIVKKQFDLSGYHQMGFLLHFIFIGIIAVHYYYYYFFFEKKNKFAKLGRKVQKKNLTQMGGEYDFTQKGNKKREKVFQKKKNE